jgi:hypothetical protein
LEISFIFTRVGTYVQRGSKFCFVVGVTDIAQNTALLSNFTMLSTYCTIACTLAMQFCPAAFPGSLARPAVLPRSLTRQPCPAGSLAPQPYTAALPGRQSFPAALPRSLAPQPCPAAFSGTSGNFAHKFQILEK